MRVKNMSFFVDLNVCETNNAKIKFIIVKDVILQIKKQFLKHGSDMRLEHI